ncbi:hypothetical protein DBR06_SOUSAS4810013, partial [Sousa chinensis]
VGVTCRGFRGGSSGGRKQTRARTHLHSVLGRGATANLEGTALGVVQKRFPSPTPRQDSHKDSSVHRSVKIVLHTDRKPVSGGDTQHPPAGVRLSQQHALQKKLC